MVVLTPFTDILCGYNNGTEQMSELFDNEMYYSRARKKVDVLTRGGLPKNERTKPGSHDRMEQCPECSNGLVYQKLIEPFDSTAGRLESRSETNAKYIDFPPFCEACRAYIIAESDEEEERRILLANLSEWMSNDDDEDHDESNKAVGYTMLLQRDKTETRSDRIKPLKGRILVSLCQKDEAREEDDCSRASNQADRVDIRNETTDNSVASKSVLPNDNKSVLPNYNSVSGEVAFNNFNHVDKLEESGSFDETIVIISNSSESEVLESDSSPSCECVLVGSEDDPHTDFASNPTPCNSYEESQEENSESDIMECSPIENIVEKSDSREIPGEEYRNDGSSLLTDVGGTEIEFLSRLNQAISKSSQDQGNVDGSRDTQIDKSYDVLVDLAEGEIAFLNKVSTFILEGKRDMDVMEQQAAALVRTQQESEKARDANNESRQEISSKDPITNKLLDNEGGAALDDQVVQDNQEKDESPKKKLRRH
eukprot:scaffold145694_cov47-Attheya_sp.AAC.1